ncbi:MAG: hypothetical protein AAF687_09585 [Pseudomonadota bacterium]
MMLGSLRALLFSLALPAALLLMPSAAMAMDDDSPVVSLRHSPWLALRFEQDGKEVLLRRGEALKSSVQLKKRPFTIVLPVRGEDDTYWITAWSEASIFEKIINKPQPVLDMPLFFQPGTSMADSRAGSGRLMLSEQGHHFLNGIRLGPDLDRHTFHVSSVLDTDLDGERRDRPIQKVDGPIYLVAWFDENDDQEINYGEYEYLVLNFR